MISLEFRIKTLARIHVALMHSITTHCLCCHLKKGQLNSFVAWSIRQCFGSFISYIMEKWLFQVKFISVREVTHPE